MMDSFYNDPLVIARKALSVSFIVCIVFINAFLITKTTGRGRVLYNPKSLTVISLALGDIVLALFPLVVQTIEYFGTYLQLPCGTKLFADVYMGYLIHFVYGVGLILLTAELVYRCKQQPQAGTTSNDITKAIIYSLTPWVLGLTIVLPLGMVGFCDGVFTQQRVKAIIGVSVLAPASLAGIISGVVMLIKLPALQYRYQDTGYQSYRQIAVHETHNTARTAQYYHAPTTVRPATYYSQYDTHKPMGSHELTPHGSVYPLPERSFQHPNDQSNVSVSTPLFPTYYQDTGFDPTYLNRERNLLLIVSTVFVLCVVPSSVYTLICMHTFEFSVLAVYEAFFWLFLFRSIITPIIWIGYSRN